MSRQFFLLPLAVCSAAFTSFLSAQTFTITYKTPAQLAVCSTDTFSVTIRNNAAMALDSVWLDLELPAGLEYLPGTISGAAGFDLTNPEKPVLLLLNQAPGASSTVGVRLYATCGLVNAINSAQLFSILLRARAGAISEEVTTATFQIQTSLLVITQIDSDSFSGVSGTLVKRTTHVQNTRLGPVKHLFFHNRISTPKFPPVPDVTISGATAQWGIPKDYHAYFDGSFFTAFGDGDELLEFGETALIEEDILLPPCIDSMPTLRYLTDVSWGCSPDTAYCQGDTTYADILILPPNTTPTTGFISGRYPVGWDRCAQVPSSDGSIRIGNSGPTSTNNLFITLTTQPLSDQTGIDPNSLRLVVHGVQTPVPASQVDTIELPVCGGTFAQAVSFYVPEIPAFDSVDVLFQVYYCGEACEPPSPTFLASFFNFGGADCAPVFGDIKITLGATDNLLADVYYDIGQCLQDGQTYDFRYVLQSRRLEGDSGVLWLNLDLPYGLTWSTDCAPVLGGKTPAIFTIDSVFTTHPVQRVRLAFELPLDADSLSMPFCLRSTCGADAAFVPQAGIDGPDSTGYFTLYQSWAGDNCGHCGFPVTAAAYLARYLDSNLDCAWPTCDDFRLRTECDRPDCGGDGGPAPDSCFVLREHHQAGRTNFGLADNDNDRVADGPGTADPKLIRRDRVIAGDTLRAVLATKIVCGDSIRDFIYQLFTETIRSDYSYANALDTFEIGPKLTNTARQHLANRDSFQVIQAIFTVWDSSANTSYSCSMQPGPGGATRHYGLVTPVNTKPPPILDELATMSYVFAPNLASFSDAGCLPPGLLLESGDSVSLQVDYKLAFNFVPYSKTHRPPLINFEMGFNANQPEDVYNYHRYDTLMFQYSGVRDSLTHPQYGIKACSPSVQAYPFYYEVRVARENMFPYEVRPLNVISDYQLTVPPNAGLQSLELSFLRLQEMTPGLQNIPLPYSIQDTLLQIDFGPAYAPLPDEGYSLSTQLIFAPNCTFVYPARSKQQVILDWTGCIQMRDPDTIRTTNLAGLLANTPRDTMTTDEIVIDFPTPAVGAAVFIKNKTPIGAPNYFVELFNPEGGLTDFQVADISQPGQIFTPQNGVFQLGELTNSATIALSIKATNTSCVPQQMWVIHGWGCQPHTQPGMAGCDIDTLKLLFRPQNPEIELNLKQLPVEAPLCDTSDYIVFEVSNADLGYAYKPFATVELPAGFQFASGSAGLAYPAGSVFIPIPDPLLTSGNTLEWDVAALQAVIGANGLPGVDLDPQNALQIRFRVLADCGVVSNAQLIFGARAEWSCGKPTNALRKASDPLPVEGIVPGYTTQITIGAPGGNTPLLCHSEQTISIGMLLTGTAAPGDSIYALLPPGFSYVPGSYTPGSHAPAGEPQIDGAVLRWPVPDGLPTNTVVAFTFRVQAGDQPRCTGAVLRIQTRQRSTAFCPAINTDCSVYVATGEAVFAFPPTDPELSIASASAVTGNDGLTDISLKFENNSPFDVPPLTYRIYLDRDGDGTLSAADTLLLLATLPGDISANGSVNAVLENLSWSPDLCALLVVLNAAENCDCQDIVFPFNNNTFSAEIRQICLGQSALVGVPGQAGHSYSWAGAPDLPCTDCPQVLYTPPGAGQYQLTLIDQGGACTAEHQFTVQVNLPPVLLTHDTVICRGQAVTLATSMATTWQWSGPGIGSDPTAPLKVRPDQTATYTVLASSAAGCILRDSLIITVLDADTIDLGIVRTCQETPVDVFGTLTDTPGTYSQTLSKVNGCDSLLVLTLAVTPNTEEARSRCARDTLLVFGEPVTDAGTYCRTFPSSIGCDSMHCVVVSNLPDPALPDPDTFYVELGKAVQLPSPGLFDQYHWAPADSLSCTDCPSPLASPVDTTDYTVTVTTGDGCTDTLVYRVVPLPPCDPVRIKIPNAFTPNGDGNNDVFTVVPYEGTEVIERLTIYNRWGQMIYESSGPNAAWDGTTDGKPAPADIYVWLLEVRCDGEVKGLRKGDVALLR